MKKDTVRFDAFVKDLRALEVRHGLYIAADDFQLCVDKGIRQWGIRNDITLPPEPILGDVPDAVISAVFANHVQHKELPSHWLTQIQRVHFDADAYAFMRPDFPHRAAIRKMMQQVTSFADKGFEAKTLAIGSSCDGPTQWASFLAQPTEWFDALLFKPHHVGVYEVLTPLPNSGYSYWDGSRWRSVAATVNTASMYVGLSDLMVQAGAMFRGLACQP